MNTRKIKMFVLTIIIILLLVNTAYAEVFGNVRTKKFHRTDCQWAQKMSPKNVVIFKNAEEAQNAGHVPCKVCKPTAGATKWYIKIREVTNEKRVHGRTTSRGGRTNTSGV